MKLYEGTNKVQLTNFWGGQSPPILQRGGGKVPLPFTVVLGAVAPQNNFGKISIKLRIFRIIITSL